MKSKALSIEIDKLENGYLVIVYPSKGNVRKVMFYLLSNAMRFIKSQL